MKRFPQNAIQIFASILFSIAFAFEAFSFLYHPANAGDSPTEISVEESLSRMDPFTTATATFDSRRFEAISRSAPRESDGTLSPFPIARQSRISFPKLVFASRPQASFPRSKDYFIFTLERMLC